jgi:5-methylcytosine-specific restriction endonuclease McrA
VDVSDIPGVLERLEQRDWSVPVRGAEVVGVLELQAMLDAKVAQLMAAFEQSSEWSEDGARSPATWVAAETRRPRAELCRWLGLGRALRAMEATEAAWVRGRISRAHVELLTPLSSGVTADAFARDEAMLVDLAGELSYGDFRQAVAYWRQLADPDGVADESAGSVANREFWITRTFGGGYTGGFNLDAIRGATADSIIKRGSDRLFEEDWARAKERLGRDPLPHELERTSAQRGADAFVEALTRSASTAPGAQAPKPLFTVLVDFPVFRDRICQLADGTVVAPESLRPHVTEAMVQRAVLESPRRVEISETTRLFTGATRRGVEVRDQRCRHPYCEDIPAERCQVDHVVPYSRGGPTTQENGRLLCPFHNRLRNKPPPPKEDRRAPPDDDDVIYEDVEWQPDG